MPFNKLIENALPTAVVVGLETNGLGVVRSLAREKIPCIAVSTPDKHPAIQTRFCEVVYTPSWDFEGLIPTLKRVGARLGRKAPLLMTRDQAVMWVSQARSELSQFFEIALPSPDTIDLLMNKRRFLRFAEQRGWPVPKTWFIRSREELMAHRDEYVYPCMLKPELKNDAFRQYSPKKAFQIQGEAQLLATYDLISQWEQQVVVQEWIGGGDDRIAFCLSYSDRTANPRASFVGRKLLQWPIQCGNTALCEPAPASWGSKLLPLTEAIWKEVSYSGLGSMEYKMRPENDEPVIVEPTVGRSDYQSEIAVVNGINLPAVAYFDLAGIPFQPTKTHRGHIKLVDGPAHIKSFWGYRKIGQMTFKQWLRLRSGKRQYVILRSGDLGPFWMSLYQKLRYKVGDILEACFSAHTKERIKKTIGLSAS